MEPLFTTKTTITLEECIKMQKYKLKWGKFINIPMAVFSLLMALFCLYYGLFSSALIFIVLAVFWIFGDAFLAKISAKKVYNSNKSIQNLEMTYYFYEDYLIQDSELGRTEIKYTDLYKINESKTHFYLRDSKITAMIIVKENCDEALCEFLRRVKI